jgi:4-amino-4-deoxy-L-arabinose transferase-like glycosyltransferase
MAAGYSYWRTSDYRLQPENGNLPQRWATLPLLFQNLKFPSLTGADWAEGNSWKVGDDFFHALGNDRPAMLASSRTMIALLSGLLCFTVFITARSVFGSPAGLVGVTLAAFSPTLLAHGGLATSDTAAALGFFISVLAWWRLLQRVTVGRFLAAGLSLGVLALSKYSVVLMAVIMPLIATVRLLRPTALSVEFGSRRAHAAGLARIGAVGGLLIGTAVLATCIIWTAYGFRYSSNPEASGDAHFVQPWPTVLFESPSRPPMRMADGSALEATDTAPGILQRFVSNARGYHLLPEAYLYGLAFVEKNARGRLAYFAGEYRMTGWREFFPVAFLVKTTLPAIALIGMGVVALATATPRRRRAWLYRLTPLLVLLAVYWAFVITTKLNIGHRHLLPVYPAFYVIAAGSVLLAARRTLWAFVILLFLGWHVVESVRIRPDYLAYFNPLAGGPERAHRLFVDSSLDWGQDLPRLREWLNLHAAQEPVFLSYFGSGSPVHEGIRATRVGDAYFDSQPRATPASLRGGVYCISATMLRRVYTHVRGPWSAEYERTYQSLEAWMQHLKSGAPNAQPTSVDGTVLSREEIESRLFNYEQLQFGRLCHFLEHRSVDARAGYSILIYRLSDAEVTFALKAPLSAINSALGDLGSPATKSAAH